MDIVPMRKRSTAGDGDRSDGFVDGRPRRPSTTSLPTLLPSAITRSNVPSSGSLSKLSPSSSRRRLAEGNVLVCLILLISIVLPIETAATPLTPPPPSSSIAFDRASRPPSCTSIEPYGFPVAPTARGGGGATGGDEDEDEPFVGDTGTSEGDRTENEDAMLDDLVNRLVAGVASDSNMPELPSESESGRKPPFADRDVRLADTTADDDADDDGDDDGDGDGDGDDDDDIHGDADFIADGFAVEEPREVLDNRKDDHESIASLPSSSSSSSSSPSKTTSIEKVKRIGKRRRKRKRSGSIGEDNTSMSSPARTTTSTSAPSKPSTATTTTTTPNETTPSPPPPVHPPPSLIPRRPNAIYRFLLSNGGPVGRSVVSLSVLLTEFLRRYVPELYHLVRYVLAGPILDPLRRPDRDDDRGRRLGTDGGTGGGGRRSERSPGRREDEIALEKMRAVASSRTAEGSGGGEVEEEDLAGGKYAHLSMAFVRKYGLGRRFRKERMEYEKVMGSLLDVEEDDGLAEDDNLETGGGEVESGTDGGSEPSVASEEETDWVVTAFTAEGEGSDRPFATILGRSHDDQYPDLDDDDDDDRHHRRRRTEALLEAAASSRIERHCPDVVPASSKPSPRRTSLRGDEEEVADGTDGGAGGVWERIRSVGSASNYVPSRILGAYPGDAPPIEEAADANGVIDLARRYGYGDWSDDEDCEGGGGDDDDGYLGYDDGLGAGKKKRRTSQTRRRKKRGGYARTDPRDTYEANDTDEAERKTRRKKRRRSEGRRESLSFGFGTGAERSPKRGGKRNVKGFSFAFGSSASFGTVPAEGTRRGTRIARDEPSYGRAASTKERRRRIAGESDVRLPMERTLDLDDSLSRAVATTRRRKRRTTQVSDVRLPMRRTMELDNSSSNVGKRNGFRSVGDSDGYGSKKKRVQSILRPPGDSSTAVQTPMQRTRAIFHEDDEDRR